MMIFEFRRHSLKNGNKPATISAEGLQFANRVGRELMSGKVFDHYAISSYERTHETLNAFADGARWNDVEERTTFAPLYLYWPPLNDLHHHCHQAEKAGQDMMQAALTHDEKFVRSASVHLANLFRSWAQTFKKDEHVLVIGHSPHIEMLVLGLTAEVTPGFPATILPGLKECQGVRIHTSVKGAEVSTIIEHLAWDLDPSDIRNELFGR